MLKVNYYFTLLDDSFHCFQRCSLFQHCWNSTDEFKIAPFFEMIISITV
jgi:hypothetical protein